MQAKESKGSQKQEFWQPHDNLGCIEDFHAEVSLAPFHHPSCDTCCSRPKSCRAMARICFAAEAVSYSAILIAHVARNVFSKAAIGSGNRFNRSNAMPILLHTYPSRAARLAYRSTSGALLAA